MDYIIIDKTSKIPLYMQISDSIKHHINLGVLKHGMQLPTEKSICSIFEISNIVVKKAYDDLVKKGLVLRIRGKGTYVNTVKPYIIDLTQGIAGLAGFIGVAKKTIISFDKVSNHTANHFLNLPIDDEIYLAKVISSINDQPILYDYILLPAKYFPNIDKIQIKHSNIYELMVKQFRLKPIKLTQSFKAINMNMDFALLLDTFKGSPGHYIRNYFYDENDQVLAFIASYGLSELLEFEVAY